jgi:hydroxymethylglutaryl-CoA lyase
MKNRFPRKVEIHEVALRDGIQNKKKIIPTEDKLGLIDRLAECGIRRIEVSAFVNPRLVPQMADAEELWERMDRKKGILYSALILNEAGLNRAIRCRVPHVGIFVSASETHSMKNTRKTVTEALKEAVNLIGKAQAAGMTVRAGVMNAFGCAYEGKIPPRQVLKLVRNFLLEEPHEICLADSSGMANPAQVEQLIHRTRDIVKETPISLHLHNTRGLGPANVWAALHSGVRIFDTSLGGSGGCPFIVGARGNIATEDTVHLLHETGLKTGINLENLIDVSLAFERAVGRKLPGVISHLSGESCI